MLNNLEQITKFVHNVGVQNKRRLKMKKQTIYFLLFFILGVNSSLSANQAEYKADGSHLFWFIQISDTHVSSFLDNQYGHRLLWTLGDAVSVISPRFVVNTGDLTDHTAGVNYLCQPQLDEWLEYRGYLEQTGMSYDFYFDVPGNHDAYTDGALSMYLEHSMSGHTFGTTQPYWTLKMPYGQYNFFATATPDNKGPQWWGDDAILTSDELIELGKNMETAGDGNFSMTFGHHPLGVFKATTDLMDLMDEFGADYYACGHEHDFSIRYYEDRKIEFRVSSMGQKPSENIGIYAVDNNTLSFGLSGVDKPWPTAVITAPGAAKRTAGNKTISDPFVPPVPNSCDNAPIRVLVFATHAVESVKAQIDGGSSFDLEQRNKIRAQWRGRFDASALSEGYHDLKVTVKAGDSREFKSVFRVEEKPCDIGEEEPDTELDDGTIVLPGDEPDGDTAVDGDEAIDGDTEVDGDEVVDGDTVIDGDTAVDGDEAVDGDTVIDGDEILDGDNTIDGDEVVDGDEIVDGDTLIDGDNIIDGDTGNLDGDQACDPGAKHCYMDVLMECNTDGNLWEVKEDCETNGQICVDEECIDKKFEGNSSGCNSSNSSSSAFFILLILGYLKTLLYRKQNSGKNTE